MYPNQAYPRQYSSCRQNMAAYGCIQQRPSAYPQYSLRYSVRPAQYAGPASYVGGVQNCSVRGSKYQNLSSRMSSTWNPPVAKIDSSLTPATANMSSIWKGHVVKMNPSLTQTTDSMVSTWTHHVSKMTHMVHSIHPTSSHTDTSWNPAIAKMSTSWNSSVVNKTSSYNPMASNINSTWNPKQPFPMYPTSCIPNQHPPPLMHHPKSMPMYSQSQFSSQPTRLPMPGHHMMKRPASDMDMLEQDTKKPKTEIGSAPEIPYTVNLNGYTEGMHIYGNCYVNVMNNTTQGNPTSPKDGQLNTLVKSKSPDSVVPQSQKQAEISRILKTLIFAAKKHFPVEIFDETRMYIVKNGCVAKLLSLPLLKLLRDRDRSRNMLSCIQLYLKFKVNMCLLLKKGNCRHCVSFKEKEKHLTYAAQPVDNSRPTHKDIGFSESNFCRGDYATGNVSAAPYHPRKPAMQNNANMCSVNKSLAKDVNTVPQQSVSPQGCSRTGQYRPQTMDIQNCPTEQRQTICDPKCETIAQPNFIPLPDPTMEMKNISKTGQHIRQKTNAQSDRIVEKCVRIAAGQTTHFHPQCGQMENIQNGSGPTQYIPHNVGTQHAQGMQQARKSDQQNLPQSYHSQFGRNVSAGSDQQTKHCSNAHPDKTVQQNPSPYTGSNLSAAALQQTDNLHVHQQQPYGDQGRHTISSSYDKAHDQLSTNNDNITPNNGFSIPFQYSRLANDYVGDNWQSSDKMTFGDVYSAVGTSERSSSLMKWHIPESEQKVSKGVIAQCTTVSSGIDNTESDTNLLVRPQSPSKSLTEASSNSEPPSIANLSASPVQVPALSENASLEVGILNCFSLAPPVTDTNGQNNVVDDSEIPPLPVRASEFTSTQRKRPPTVIVTAQPSHTDVCPELPSPMEPFSNISENPSVIYESNASSHSLPNEQSGLSEQNKAELGQQQTIPITTTDVSNLSGSILENSKTVTVDDSEKTLYDGNQSRNVVDDMIIILDDSDDEIETISAKLTSDRSSRPSRSPTPPSYTDDIFIIEDSNDRDQYMDCEALFSDGAATFATFTFDDSDDDLEMTTVEIGREDWETMTNC